MPVETRALNQSLLSASKTFPDRLTDLGPAICPRGQVLRRTSVGLDLFPNEPRTKDTAPEQPTLGLEAGFARRARVQSSCPRGQDERQKTEETKFYLFC